MITHYRNDSSTTEWIHACLEVESEGQIVPEVVQTNFSRVVSRDVLQGCAAMEAEAVPA